MTAPIVTTVTITNGNQLPRQLFQTLPGETVEQAVSRIAAAYPGQTINVFVLGKMIFIQQPGTVA